MPPSDQLYIAMAQNESNTTSVSASPSIASTTTNQQTNPSATTGNPIFIEHDKPTHAKLVAVSDTHGLQVSYSGRGVVKGINF
jgi:hypothetical protein